MLPIRIVVHSIYNEKIHKHSYYADEFEGHQDILPSIHIAYNGIIIML